MKVRHKHLEYSTGVLKYVSGLIATVEWDRFPGVNSPISVNLLVFIVPAPSRKV